MKLDKANSPADGQGGNERTAEYGTHVLLEILRLPLYRVLPGVRMILEAPGEGCLEFADAPRIGAEVAFADARAGVDVDLTISSDGDGHVILEAEHTRSGHRLDLAFLGRLRGDLELHLAPGRERGGEHLIERFRKALRLQVGVFGRGAGAHIVNRGPDERRGYAQYDQRADDRAGDDEDALGPGLQFFLCGCGWMLSTQCTSSGFSTTGMSRFTTTGSWPLRQSTQESGSVSLALISWWGT